MIYFLEPGYSNGFPVSDGKELWERLEPLSPITNILYDSHGMRRGNIRKDQGDIAKASRWRWPDR